jgi:hypothetical protein
VLLAVGLVARYSGTAAAPFPDQLGTAPPFALPYLSHPPHQLLPGKPFLSLLK